MSADDPTPPTKIPNDVLYVDVGSGWHCSGHDYTEAVDVACAAYDVHTITEWMVEKDAPPEVLDALNRLHAGTDAELWRRNHRLELYVREALRYTGYLSALQDDFTTDLPERMWRRT